MGCSNTKPRPPRNPIEKLMFLELERERLERQKAKDEQKAKKLEKKLAKKQKKKKPKFLKRNSHIRKSQSRKSVEPTVSNHESEKDREEEFNRKVEDTIEKQLNSDLCAFALDQATFTMDFSANYENELTATLAEFLNKENYVNQNLEEHSILLANPLDAAVAKWIRFKPTHGPGKMQSQILQPPAIYVVFENIDISRPSDVSYDSISPLCKVNMEIDSYRTTPCKEEYIDLLRDIKKKGYVRLRLRESTKINGTHEIYACGKSNRSNRSIYSNKAVSMASSGYGSECDYDYTYINLLNSHQPLAKLKMDNKKERRLLGTKFLPDSCVSTLGSYIDATVFDRNEDDEDDDDDDGNQGESDIDAGNTDGKKSKAFRDYETMQAIRHYKLEQERRQKLLHRKYLNSKEFMCYFGELFRQKISKQLSVSEKDLESATYRCVSIYTKDYEFIPAIHVAQNANFWPECAFRFRSRERPVRKHPITGEKIQWPTRAMMRQIETFGYHVIPLGYAPKRKRNPFRELEWCIVFPKAERYLERHLSHTQAKILMITKALVKTFIEPVEKDKSLLFAVDHLRTHLFWECERDSTAWPEEFLGDVLVRFIESFLYRLRHKRLRDYFIEERNLFENIPEYSLLSVYSILSDIVANPLMHLMVAFRNLQLNEKFFPKLNFKNLFLNLVYDNVSHLKQLSKNSHELVEEKSDDSELESSWDEDILSLEKSRKQSNGKLRRETIQLKLEIEKCKAQEKARRPSVESIDVEFLFSNELNSTYNTEINQGVESLRRTNIIEMFLEHILAMVKKAASFGNIERAKTWLRQAKRLTKFYNNLGCDMYAKAYDDSISVIFGMLEELKDGSEFSEESIPTLPTRIIESKRPRKVTKATDSDAYEEVIPMDDSLPSIQSAMQAWQNKLKRIECSSECMRTLKLERTVVDIHKREENSCSVDDSSEECEIKTMESRRSEVEGSKVKLTTVGQKGDSSVSKNSVKFKKDIKSRTVDGHVNEAYESFSDEFETDTEGESSMYSATDTNVELSETQDTHQEISFTEPKKSLNKVKRYDSTDSEKNVTENKRDSKTSKIKSSLKSNDKAVIQIETESSEETDRDEVRPRPSFRCLQDMSVSGILQSEETQDEQSLKRDCTIGINYDVSPSNSNDQILDLVKLTNRAIQNQVEKRRSSKSKRSSRNARNRRHQRRKRHSKKTNENDLETEIEIENVDTNSDVEDSKNNDCIINIEQNGSKGTDNENGSEQTSIFAKYINTENIVKRFPVVSPEMVQTVQESTQKFMATIKNKEKMTEIRDVIKTKTLKLKGALLQSSDT